jgi:hypothetical protein
MEFFFVLFLRNFRLRFRTCLLAKAKAKTHPSLLISVFEEAAKWEPFHVKKKKPSVALVRANIANFAAYSRVVLCSGVYYMMQAIWSHAVSSSLAIFPRDGCTWGGTAPSKRYHPLSSAFTQ